MRALDIVWQAYVHVEVGDAVLFSIGAVPESHRVIDVLHPHAVDRDLARVGVALYVLDSLDILIVNIVCKRYYSCIIKESKMDGRVIAELVLHLGRIACGDGVVEGLTPTQWTALRYFSRANRFSRTPSAFAAFHGTTRGTASQTIKNLETQGYLTRLRLEADGRSARLDLTDKAKAILVNDIFESVVRAADALPTGVRDQFANVLQRMLGQVASERCKPAFGTCASCKHLQGDGYCREGQAPYTCGFSSGPLLLNELGELCVYFSPDKPVRAVRP